MFFSVIIPTYNPRAYIEPLLTSITHNKCLDEIEVIISDDQSTEIFDDILEKYDQLNIKTIVNETHCGFPRTGRQNGAEAAKGTWICFADQDDYFIDNAFDDVMNYIKTNNIKNVLFSNFIEELVETGKQIFRDGLKGWTHGKFYEKSFLNKYNIGYDYVNYCEDINLSTKVDCVMCAEHLPQNKYDKHVYIWRRRNDSLADLRYFVDSMPEYVIGTAGVIINYVDKFKEDKDLFMAYNIKFIRTILNVYFNFQTNVLFDKKESLLNTIQIFQKIFNKFKEITKFTASDIVYYVYYELIELYRQTRQENYEQVPFVERMSFQDWFLTYFE